MEKEIISRMEKLLDRELDTEEKERLQRIQDTLQIADNDALWAVISAMENPLKKAFIRLPLCLII